MEARDFIGCPFNNAHLKRGRTFFVYDLAKHTLKSSAGVVLLALFLGILQRSGATVYNVTDHGAPTNTDFALRQILLLAQPGDTIYFPNGTYSIVNTIVPKSKMLIYGQSQSGVLIQFNGQASIVDLSGLRGVEISSLTLDGVMNSNVAHGIYATTGYNFKLHNLTIKNLSLTNNYGPFGIHFNGSV